MDSVRSKLFAALRSVYQERDRLWLLVQFRKAFIERLLAEGEESAEATAGDYQRETAEKDREYDSTASELERKRELNAEETDGGAHAPPRVVFRALAEKRRLP